MKKRWVIGGALLLCVLGAMFYALTVGFQQLMSVEDLQYDDPAQAQIGYFLECCGLRDLPIEYAVCLFVSDSPHQSDSRMALVFPGDVTDWWDDFTSCPDGRSIDLPNNNTVTCDAEKHISTFVWACRLTEGNSLLQVSNVSGAEISQITALAPPPRQG